MPHERQIVTVARSKQAMSAYLEAQTKKPVNGLTKLGYNTVILCIHDGTITGVILRSKLTNSLKGYRMTHRKCSKLHNNCH